MSAGWLIASAELGKAFQAHSRRSGGWSDTLWFLSLVLLAVGFFVLMYYWDKIKVTFVRPETPEEILFHELCKLHNLSKVECELLTKIVEQASPPQPAFVFVDRTLMVNYSRQPNAPKRTCAALMKKLYGSDS
ncbi:MAG: hypothetical protein Tsb009_26330 [Planctomycetaceae bacterium]